MKKIAALLSGIFIVSVSFSQPITLEDYNRAISYFRNNLAKKPYGTSASRPPG